MHLARDAEIAVAGTEAAERTLRFWQLHNKIEK